MTDGVQDVTGKMWRIGRCVGSGAFARVYETPTEETAVVKIFKTKQSYVKELFAYQSLFPEATTEKYKDRRGLGHLGFPKLHAHGSGHRNFIVIQKLYPVKQLIEESYRDNNLVMLIAQVLDVLEFMHAVGWTHNDIKYDNIMVDRYRNFYLIDFGLTSSFLEVKETPVEAPTAVGTLKYMSVDVHRGFVNVPRGDLLNLVFMLKLLLTSPWDVDKYAFSARTSLLMAKEAFMSDPRCGPFTPFCKSVCKLLYRSAPNYNHLKTLLPAQPKVEAIKTVYLAHCGNIVIPSWSFSVIFQTQILPYLFRMSQKLHGLKRLKKGKIDVPDLIFIFDMTHDGTAFFSDGLTFIGGTPADFTPDARLYVSACVESWVIHVAQELKKIIASERGCSISLAVQRLTTILVTARP